VSVEYGEFPQISGRDLNKRDKVVPDDFVDKNLIIIVDTIFLSANSRGTEVTYSVDIKYKFPFFILGIFVGTIFNKIMDEQIKNLEAVLGPVQG
jgi:hypothetical protein